MASRKHVALFEVIQKDKRFERKARGVAAPALPAAPLPRVVLPHAPNRAAATKRRGRDWLAQGHAAWQEFLIWLRPRLASLKLHLARHGSVLTGLAAAVVMMGAILCLRQLTQPRRSAMPPASNAVSGPGQRPVLEALQARATIAPTRLSPELEADFQQAGAQLPTVLSQPGKRITNYQYVLIQSYLDEKTANDAKAFLDKNGIACTIERGVKGWRADFYQVIGLQGFARASGSQYLAYRKCIDALSEKFAPASHSYKRFAPQAIKW